MKQIRLGVNVDHVATLRNARGGSFPCPIKAALAACEAGADGITAHLREDRRHIRDADIERLKKEIPLPLNLEMAATEEMQKIALRVIPNAVCIVPEKRAELTTEGGLDVLKQQQFLADYIKPLKNSGIRVSLFVDADFKQIQAASDISADIIEINTGKYSEVNSEAYIDRKIEIAKKIADCAKYANELSLEIHAGHGLNYENVSLIAEIPEICELNIGHFLISESLFSGLKETVAKMKYLINSSRS